MKKKLNKFLVRASILPGLIVLIILVDMIIAGSIYRPAVYIYRAKSWWECKDSLSQWCKERRLTQETKNQKVSAQYGTVVTSQHIASKVGLQVLKNGGNAVDAAVAVGYALAVTDPCCGNIGGGGFMLVRFKDGKNTFINFREIAPQAATGNMFLDEKGEVIPELSTNSYKAVAIPGTVKGLDYALDRYGTLERNVVMLPAIDLAEKGFKLTQGDVDILNQGIKKFRNSENSKKIFLDNNKLKHKVGDWLVQEDLAKTLKLVSRNGPDEFYGGSISKKLVNSSQINNGILSEADFLSYEVQEIQPLECDYRGYQVITAPPPGGGITLCEMLNILEGYDLHSLGFQSKDSLHKFFTSMLFSYLDRNTLLGDPNFVNNPTERLLSDEYAASIRAKIPKKKAVNPKSLYSGITVNEGQNTTHYSIIDKDGNSVAVTYTINSFFGSGFIAGDTGFFLNNEMDDFTAKPGIPNNFGLVQGSKNKIEPGKQPLSSMAPTIVTKDNKISIITGSPGGSTIPTTILQVLTNFADYKMTPNQSVNMPRTHYQGMPNWVITEPNALSNSVVQDLWEMGYKVIPFRSWGAAESIFVNSESKAAAINDHRKPAGYSNGK